MAPKIAVKRTADVQKVPVRKEKDENIDRPPESSSESEDNGDPSDIVGTDFRSGSSKVEGPATQGKLSPSKNGNGVGKGGAKKKAASTRTGTRSAKEAPSPSNFSVGSSSSKKRKGEEELPKLGAGMTTAMGFTTQSKKKAKKTYGSQPLAPRIYTKPKPKPKGAASPVYISSSETLAN